MSGEAADEFERRTRQLLESSADSIEGRLRSRLTQARYAALAARHSAARPRWRGWAPVGVVAAAVLIMLFSVTQPGGRAPLVGMSLDTNAALEDMELLTDADALDLAQEQTQRQEADYDFYEWAVAEGDGDGDGAAVGT